jgi:hypothetical protein
MRLSTTLIFTLALSSFTSTALAGIEMTEEEMFEASSLVVRGAITDVSCDGEPTHNGNGMVTPYMATLTVTEVEKGDESMTEVTLPFANVVLDNPDEFLSCGWAPHYRKGHSGLYYLVTGADTDHHTLVDSAGFRPDDDSSPEDLPSCVDEEEVEVTLCEETGGDWEECVFGIAETCANRDSGIDGASVCSEGCLCPEDAPIWTDEGCAPESVCGDPEVTPEVICEETGGDWEECARLSCGTCDDCIVDCLCPVGELFEALHGCVTASQEVSPTDGGSESAATDAGSESATDGEDGGCNGTGSGSPDLAWMLGLCVLAALGSRRMRVIA